MIKVFCLFFLVVHLLVHSVLFWTCIHEVQFWNPAKIELWFCFKDVLGKNYHSYFSVLKTLWKTNYFVNEGLAKLVDTFCQLYVFLNGLCWICCKQQNIEHFRMLALYLIKTAFIKQKFINNFSVYIIAVFIVDENFCDRTGLKDTEGINPKHTFP